MRGLRRFFARFAGLFSRACAENELEREIGAHLALLQEEHERRGLPPEEARLAARRAYGGVEQAKELHREARSFRFVEQLIQDLRYAARQLRRSPGFAVVAILTLALGIGANTAIFSLVDAVMLRNLPVKDPQQLTSLEWVGQLGVDQTGPGSQDKAGNTVAPIFSYPAFERLKAGSKGTASLFGFVPLGDVNLTLNGAHYLVPAEVVTPGYFGDLGVRPELGRTLVPADFEGGAAPAAVISDALWTTRFHRSREALGSTITFGGTAYTIVGVAPRGFFGLDPSRPFDLWAPFVSGRNLGPQGQTASPWGESPFAAERWWWMYIVARPRAGVARETLQAQLDTILQRSLAAAQLSAPQRAHIRLVSAGRGLDTLRQMYAEPLLILLAIVGLVLLMACANLAALLSARGASRGREIAVRLSLGASRARLVRQLLVESALLAFSGAAVGLLFAWWGLRLLTGLTTEELPLSIGINGPVLLFTGFVAVATALAFGLAPAFRATRGKISGALQQLSRQADRARGSLLPEQMLVAAQVAASLLLLVGAGLFLRTLWNYEAEPVGFDASHVLLFRASFDRGTSDGAEAQFLSRLRERVSALPGVQAVGTSNIEFLSGDTNSWPMATQNQAKRATGVYFLNVGPGFFDAMRIPLLEGRPIGPADASAAYGGAVISQGTARAVFGAQNPLGQRITFPGLNHRTYEIVGIARDTKYMDFSPGFPKTVYLPFSKGPDGADFEVRTAGNPAAFAPAVRAMAREIDPGVPLAEVTTQSDLAARALTQQRLFVRVSGFFTPLALLLAFVGFYGILSYAVARRTAEIGIRMALGAQRRDVARLIFRQAGAVVAAGIAAGVLAALGLARLIEHQLFGVRATDPLTYALASIALIVVALLACWVPARKAMRVDPMTALRHE